MQVYVPDLASFKTQIETKLALIIAVSNIIHNPPLLQPNQPKPNFHVQIRSIQPSLSSFGSLHSPNQHLVQPTLVGTITFPTVRLGNKFLNAVANRPIFLFDQPVALEFQRALKNGRIIIPHPQLIRSLKDSPFQPTETLLQELKEIETLQRPLGVSLISFGNITRHLDKPAYSPEYIICLPSESAQLRFDSNHRSILITWSTQTQTKAVVVELCTLFKIEATAPSVILWLERPPKLEEVSRKDYLHFSRRDSFQTQQEADLRHRVHGFTHAKEDIFPFVNDRLQIQFASHEAFEEFCSLKVTLPLPRVKPSQRLILEKSQFDPERIRDIHLNLVCLAVPVAFQIETLLHNRILLPYQILRVCKAITSLDEALGEKALIKFIDLYKNLPKPGENQPTGRATQTGQEPIYLQILQSAIKISAKEDRLLGSSFQTPDSFPCRTVIITPTRLCLQGPQTDQSNSILRLYQQTENFLRVSVADEDTNALRSSRDVDIKHLLRTRYLPFLTKGLILCGRKFEFLGYSSSALKDHQAWFVCPFHRDNELVTAASIRDKLGNFTKVIRIPARYMARISQAFTSTRKSLTLHRSEVKRMSDVVHGNSCFTDGVGTISKALADEVNKILNRANYVGRNQLRSTCYQIRLGGFKGMLSLDPTLKGKQVRMRPSMDKFDAPDSLTLDIAGTFAKPLVAYLNRPLIKLLEDLGISSDVFLSLQEKLICQVENSRSSPKLAAELMQQYSLAPASQMPSILTKLSKLLGDKGVSMQSNFVEECYDLMIMQCLKDLKYRARIPLEKSYTLVGVADEDNFLHPNSIYACVQHPHKPPQYLKGSFAITRSPSLHPGDVRVVTAVGQLDSKQAPRLSSLVNCVVFSVQGKRSLPSCLGGGDLDGDLYTVIGLPELVPSRSKIHQPASYTSPPMKELNRDCTIEDGAKFFLDYISSDLVGMIATRHLHIADQCPEGTLHESCIRLAELHSDAVDYPKTGVPVDIRSLPSPPNRMRPDFMCQEFDSTKKGEQYYESPNALGKLFRKITAERIEVLTHKISSEGDIIESYRVRNPEERQMGKCYGKLDSNRTLTKLIQRKIKKRYGHQDGFGGEVERQLKIEFESLMGWFGAELMKICKLNSLSQAQTHLTESEAFLGIILVSCDRFQKRAALSRLLDQTSILFDQLRAAILGPSIQTDMHGEEDDVENDDDDDEDDGGVDIQLSIIKRAYTAWLVATQSQGERFGTHSFGFITLGIILNYLYLE